MQGLTLARRGLYTPRGRPTPPFRPNFQSWQSAGLLHWWPGNVGTGDKLYELVRGYDLTGSEGEQVRRTENVGGGMAHQGDGSNDRWDGTQNSTLTGNPSFTISTWVYIPTTVVRSAGTGYEPWIYWGADSTMNSVFFGLAGTTADKIFIGFFNGGLTTDAGVPTGEWIHVVWRRTGGFAANTASVIFVNGAEVARSNSGLPNDTSTPNISAGVYRMYGNPNNGVANYGLFDTRIYNYPITQNRIENLCAPETRWELYDSPRRTVTYFGPSGADFNAQLTTPDDVQLLNASRIHDGKDRNAQLTTPDDVQLLNATRIHDGKDRNSSLLVVEDD